MYTWRYIGYDPESRRIKEGFEYKNPEIDSLTQPDEDYVNITTPELLIDKQVQKYPERERVGKEYSNFMDARLIILGESIPDENLSEAVRSEIDTLFTSTRFEISLGRWISARREVQLVQESEGLQMMIDTFSLPIDQKGLIQEVKDYIELQIENLY